MTVRTHWQLPGRTPSDQSPMPFIACNGSGCGGMSTLIVDQINTHNRTTHTALNLLYTYTTATRVSLEQLRNQIPHA
jgi:hypothetical protein